jgi:hypothetical protein
VIVELASDQINLFLNKTSRNVSTDPVKNVWERTPCKKADGVQHRQGNLLQWNNSTGVNKTSLHFALCKMGWPSTEKNPFFKHGSSM